MDFAVLFQGQGSCRTAFVRKLYGESEAVRNLFAQAREITGVDFSALLHTTVDAGELETDMAQPLIFLMEYASYCHYSGKMKEKPLYLAGHSLGEYTALAAAGAVSFPEALALVMYRGRCMLKAGSDQETGMMWIPGRTKQEIEKAIHSAGERDSGFMAVIANDNSGTQMILSGYLDSLKRTAELLGQDYYKLLKVKKAFHSPFMGPAAEQLAEYMKKITFYLPDIPVISNVTAKPYAASWTIPDLLAKQMTHPVRWRETMEYLLRDGITVFLQATDSFLFRGFDKELGTAASWHTCGQMAEGEIYDFNSHYSARNKERKNLFLGAILKRMAAGRWKQNPGKPMINKAVDYYHQIMELYQASETKELTKEEAKRGLDALDSVLAVEGAAPEERRRIKVQLQAEYGVQI